VRVAMVASISNVIQVQALGLAVGLYFCAAVFLPAQLGVWTAALCTQDLEQFFVVVEVVLFFFTREDYQVVLRLDFESYFVLYTLHINNSFRII